MNRHLTIKMPCFCVVELRKATAPAHATYLHRVGNSYTQYSVMACIPRLESDHFNRNLFDTDLTRASLAINKHVTD